MERSDFITVEKIHIESCRKLVKYNGVCSKAVPGCVGCPFSHDNSTHGIPTCSMVYSTSAKNPTDIDLKLVESALKFTGKFSKEVYQ